MFNLAECKRDSAKCLNDDDGKRKENNYIHFLILFYIFGVHNKKKVIEQVTNLNVALRWPF